MILAKPSQINLEEYLAVPETFDRDYNFFHDRRARGTCKWILANTSFVEWLADDRLKPRVLWIHGNPASGKSIISSFLINHLAKRSLPCQYFFIRFTDLEKRALSVLLRSLAWQIANSIPQYAEQLIELQKAATNLKAKDFRSIWQFLYMQSLFQLAILDPIYWVIDGLDEADSPTSLIKLLLELQGVNIPLRVLIVSRKTPDIASAVQKLGRQMNLGSIQVEANQSDLRSYVEQELEVIGEGFFRQETVKQLLERAKGNFLWVHLAVQKINSCLTKPAVEEALKDLPDGMEALYDRMAVSVQSQPTVSDRELGLDILGWAACSQRPLSVEEFSDAMSNKGLLEIHKTVSGLCGGFVVVDKDGKVAMIHQTAKVYVTQPRNSDNPSMVPKKVVNDRLFKRCVSRLMDPNLRSLMNRNQAPALLDYAVGAWFVHLSRGQPHDPQVLESVMKFIRGPSLLTWISIAARKKNLETLVKGSRCLTDVVKILRRSDSGESLAYHRAIDLIEKCSVDLIKIVGRFGNTLVLSPDAIYRLIPPFCPKDSMIYTQFGHKEIKALRVSGLASNDWDDCLAHFSFEDGAAASTVIAAGKHILILANTRKRSQIIIYNASTFVEHSRITSPERVMSIQTNRLGDRLVSYGYVTTKVWDIATAKCLRSVTNPARHPKPHSLLFIEKDQSVLCIDEHRCIRSFGLGDDSSQWIWRAQIREHSSEDIIINDPVCTSFSSDGHKVAFGYRGHAPTVWQIDPPMLLGQCDEALVEVFRLRWHPSGEEVIGLTQTGLLFKWNPYDTDPSSTVQSGASNLATSLEGSFIATGDAVGTIKIYATEDLSLLYQLSSQEPVLDLFFGKDARRIFDIRGIYGNVWEPEILVRIAASSEHPDHNNDIMSEIESVAQLSIDSEHHMATVDNVIALSGQSNGPLYCYGIEDGVVTLGEVGRGQVCELERTPSHMPIEQVAWSDDGRLAAMIDLSGRLSVKKITKATSGVHDVDHVFDLVLPPHQGHITQLISHPSGHGLLASTASVIYSVNLDTQDQIQTELSQDLCGNLKWMFHTSIPGHVLGFGTNKLYVFDWPSLQQREIHSYFPPRQDSALSSLLSPLAITRRPSIIEDADIVGRLITNVDSPFILLTISHFTSSGHLESEYLVFKVSDIHIRPEGDNPTPSNKHLNYTLVPENIASRIREPLAFLSRGRLVFLGIDRWICVSRLMSSSQTARAEGERSPGTPLGAVEQFYFLPGDWATANEAHLCTVMPDGTLLCPHAGDVAAVQCSRLRR